MTPNYGAEFLKKVSEVEVRMKQIIKDGVFAGLPTEEINKRLLKLIEKFSKEIPDDYRDKQKMIDALLYTRKELYNQFVNQVKPGFLEAKHALEQMLGIKIKDRNEFLRALMVNIKYVDQTKVEFVEAVQQRNPWAYEQGAPVILDYYKKVRLAIEEIAQSPIRAKQGKRSLLSLRSLAEMKIRDEYHKEQLRQFKERGVQFVFVSTHADCSERCEPWQGRLHSLDASTGVIDGWD